MYKVTENKKKGLKISGDNRGFKQLINMNTVTDLLVMNGNAPEC